MVFSADRSDPRPFLDAAKDWPFATFAVEFEQYYETVLEQDIVDAESFRSGFSFGNNNSAGVLFARGFEETSAGYEAGISEDCCVVDSDAMKRAEVLHG